MAKDPPIPLFVFPALMRGGRLLAYGENDIIGFFGKV